MAPRRNAKPSKAQLSDMRKAAGVKAATDLGIDADAAPGLIDFIEQSSARPRNVANSEHADTPRDNPNYSDPTPLSDVVKGHLAGLGIHGLSTHGEALKHLHQTANAFGFKPGATKRLSTGALGKLASHVASVTGTTDPSIAGNEASIIDQATVLHEGITAMLQPFKYPQQDIEPGNPQTGRNPKTKPKIESQSLDDVPVDKPTKSEVAPTPAPVSRTPEAHGRMLRNLPPVPKPDTTKMGPRKAKKAMADYDAAVAAQLATSRSNTGSRSGSMALGHSESKELRPFESRPEDTLWSFDPDDGGWAYRPAPAPIKPTNTPEPTTTAKKPSKAPKQTKPKNPPIKLTDMVDTILKSEKDILEARGKFPEQDNPLL